MINLLGWLGAFFFAISGIPQARQCYKQGHGRGINPLFMWCWLLGEILYLLYIPLRFGAEWPLIANLVVGFISVVVILRYIYFPRVVKYTIPYRKPPEILKEWLEISRKELRGEKV